MSIMKKYGDKPGEYSLSDEEAAEIEADMRKLLAMTRSPMRMARDAKGNEYAPSASGKGGQVVSKGQGGGGSDSRSEKRAATKPDSHADTAPKDVSGTDVTDVDEEATTPPPPGKALNVNVEETHEND